MTPKNIWKDLFEWAVIEWDFDSFEETETHEDLFDFYEGFYSKKYRKKLVNTFKRFVKTKQTSRGKK